MLSFIFILIAIPYSLYVLYSCLARYIKIKGLPLDLITESEKHRYLKVLSKYILIASVGCLLSFISLISPVMEIRCIIPVISIIICSYMFQDLLDEIQDFDISKKDSDIIMDFFKKRDEDAKTKSEGENKDGKIKKQYSDKINQEENEETEETKNKTETAEESKEN